MEKIVHHLWCPKRFWNWYKNNISGIISGAGFFPSKVVQSSAVFFGSSVVSFGCLGMAWFHSVAFGWLGVARFHYVAFGWLGVARFHYVAFGWLGVARFYEMFFGFGGVTRILNSTLPNGSQVQNHVSFDLWKKFPFVLRILNSTAQILGFFGGGDDSVWIFFCL